MVSSHKEANDIIDYCLSHFEDVVLVDSWGEKGMFYNPNKTLKRGVYVLTIKEKDGDNDKSSMLNRENIYRINIGLKKETFIQKFKYIPKRPVAGETVKMDFDFTAVDTIMPHPVYAWMGWICVLNPTQKTLQEFELLIKESYEFAKEKFLKKKK
jgi:hypothetical protein